MSSSGSGGGAAIHRVLLNGIALVLTFSTVLGGTTSRTVYYTDSKPSCETAQNVTMTCLHEEITMLHSRAAAIHGNLQRLCDPLASEQTCYLCKMFNKTQSCLHKLVDSCEFVEMQRFIHSHTVPYLGTLASLCSRPNVLNEIYENRECYNGITVNLRKCFNALDVDRSCGAVSQGFSCANKISEAYCATLFNEKGDHKHLSSLYLRALEPVIDLQNCTTDSELTIAKIYPEYQHRWRWPEKAVNTPSSLIVQVNVNTITPAAVMNPSGSPVYNSSERTLSSTLLLLLACMFIIICVTAWGINLPDS